MYINFYLNKIKNVLNVKIETNAKMLENTTQGDKSHYTLIAKLVTNIMLI